MKLAIIKNNIDLLRIISTVKEDTIEFKISLLGNEYIIEYWKKGLNLVYKFFGNNELSYHNSLKQESSILPALIHSKEISNGIINYKYKFPNVVDINTNSEFPIPLLKLVYNNNFTNIYKPKKDHRLFEFADDNTLEIYFISKSYDYVKFMNKWRFIDVLWNITTIDYVIDRVKLSKQFIEKLEGRGNSILKTMVDFNDFKLIFRFYSTEESDNKICFYENYDFAHMLANTPICLADDETKVIKSKVASAFSFDLECQLKDGVDVEKLKVYEKIFASSFERIRKENKYKEIFFIPQIKVINSAK